MNINRNHRTALVIDAREGFSGDFAERVNRLLESVNGANIKVDVYTLGQTQTSVGLTPGAPTKVASSTLASGDALADAQHALKSAGYSQILTSQPGK